MKLFVPFASMTNPSTTWSSVIYLNRYVHSTDSVTDHDNPAVKSIVIHTILKYNVLSYKKHSNQCNKTISWDSQKNLKICHWITSWKAMVLILNAMWYLQMNLWKNKNPFHQGGWLHSMRERGVDSQQILI